jgi:hypothetical protein
MITKYIIILLILFLLINIFRYKDNFFSENKIFFTGDGFNKELSTKNNNLFKNINTINTIKAGDLPKLTFHSYEKCPKLYKLFKGLSTIPNNTIDDMQIENVDGLRFRNKIRSAFYNIDRVIRIEHPLIELERKILPIDIRGNINTKLSNLNNSDFLFGVNNKSINIDTFEKYFEDIYTPINKYEELIIASNLIFLHLENRIPKKISELFIRLKDILEEEKNKIIKLKNTDPKALFLKYFETQSPQGTTKDYEITESFINTAEAEDNTEAEQNLKDTIYILNFNEQEKEYLIKIQNYIKNPDYNYSYLVENIITLEFLNKKKNKAFCARLLLYVYRNINNIVDDNALENEIEKIKTLLKDYKVDGLNTKYEEDEKNVNEIETIKNELKKLKTDDKGESGLILDNPNFIFNLGNDNINYTSKNHIEQTAKQVSFNVKIDFTEDDVVNFVEYCFNLYCFGAIDIDLLAFTKNHYRVLPCFNKEHKDNTYYYILPERIRKVVTEEGKEYTRAKCTGCASNIIIFFNKLPDKFKYYEALELDMDSITDKFINNILE